MLKLLRLGMVLHSKLSYLATLLSSGILVCSLTMPLSGGSAWNREQNVSKAADTRNRTAIMGKNLAEYFKTTRFKLDPFTYLQRWLVIGNNF